MTEYIDGYRKPKQRGRAQNKSGARVRRSGMIPGNSFSLIRISDFPVVALRT